MRPVKRRRIGLLTKDRGADGVNEPEQERRVTVVEEGDAITVTFDGDTEEELEDELDEDEVEEGNHSSMDSSPLTTRVLISEQITSGTTSLRLIDTAASQADDASQNETNEGENTGLSSNRSERLDNIWTKCDSALRDLLVFLVKKHRVDEVYDSKVKAQNWEKLIIEFNEKTGGMVGMPKAQIIRKWHNWKQYNKQRSKQHPFIIVGNISEEEVVGKCQELMNQAKFDSTLASFLAKGGNEPQAIVDDNKKVDNAATARGDNTEEVLPEISADEIRLPGNEKLKRLRDRDFLVRRTGISAASLSIKKLEHEIALESLTYEQERWKIRAENNQLLQQKIQKQSELADVKLERAKTELALKRHECLSLGLSV